MEVHILPILTFFSLALVISHAAVEPEIYWKNVLPNVAMPKAVRNSLPESELMDNKATSVNVGKGTGVHVNTNNPNGGHTNVNVGPKSGVGVSTGGNTHVSVSPRGGVGVKAGKPNKGGAHVGVGKGGVTVRAGPKKKPVHVDVKPGKNPFAYNYAASETQLQDDPTRSLFFLEKNMKPGQQMTMHFTQSTNGATFLSRDEAESYPFSTSKIPEILGDFGVEPSSVEAKTMEETVKGCESKSIRGEDKYCATSLESMVDYAKSNLGKNVKAMSTEANEAEDKPQKFIISQVRKVAREDEAVVCHKQNYAYAVFYCHKSEGTSAYILSLKSEDGSKSRAVAICHKNTSAWNPKHLAFQVLKVTPGSVPICHFLPEDHIVWVRN